MLVVHLPETKNELKSLCRLEMQILFIKMNLMWLAFNTIWLMTSEYLAKRTQSDKVLRDKAFKIASDPKYDGYQRGLASMVYKFFEKNLLEVVSLINQIISWQINFTNQLFQNLRREKSIHHLETIFGVLI